jgi:hypothetical protein
MVAPPNSDMVAQAVLQWAGSCRKLLLHASATVQNTNMQCFRSAPLGEVSRPQPCLRAGLRIPHLLVLSMTRFHLNSHNLGMELGRHQGGVCFARCFKRCALGHCAALRMHDHHVVDEAHLLFSCPATAAVRRERCFEQLPCTPFQDLTAIRHHES